MNRTWFSLNSKYSPKILKITFFTLNLYFNLKYTEKDFIRLTLNFKLLLWLFTRCLCSVRSAYYTEHCLHEERACWTDLVNSNSFLYIKWHAKGLARMDACVIASTQCKLPCERDSFDIVSYAVVLSCLVEMQRRFD